MDFANKVSLNLDLNSVGGYEVCCLEEYDKHYNKPIMIEYTKCKTDEEASVELNDFGTLAL